MYIWNIEKLKDQIRNNELTEKDRFIYVLIYVVLGAIVMELMTLMPLENGNVWDLINSVAAVLIIAVGTTCAFKANEANDGEDFLGKYFAISFVVAIRFIVYAIPLFVLLFIYYLYAFDEHEEIASGFIDVVPFILWYIALFWRICVHIKQVGQKTV